MRKIYNFAICLAAVFAAVSCTSELKEVSSLEKMSFEVTASSDTKSQLLSDYSVAWQAGDAISIFDAEGNRKFTTEGSGASATFTGEAAAGEDYYALYPYDEDATIASGTISTTIPMTQMVPSGTFDPKANISAGLAAGTTLQMLNAGALLMVTLSESDIASVVIETNAGEKIAGATSIEVGSAGIGAVTAGASSVTMKPASGKVFAPGTYYVVVAPVAVSAGFKLTLTNSAGVSSTRSSSNPCSLQRANIMNLQTVDSGVEYMESLTIHIPFKTESKLYDNSDATGSGSVWPFKETKGSSTAHAGSTVLTTTDGNYVVTIVSGLKAASGSTGGYYPNSKHGWQLYGNGADDPLVFGTPVIPGSKLVEISYSLGSNTGSGVSVTTVGGEIVPGGEKSSKPVACTLYTIKLSGTTVGTQYYINTGATGTFQVMQLNFTYESALPASVASVTTKEETDAEAELKGNGVTFSGSACTVKAGAEDISCGFEIMEDGGAWTSVDAAHTWSSVTGSFEFMYDFSGLKTGSEYVIRAWSALKSDGLKKYGTECYFYPGAVLMNFWTGTINVNPFVESISAGKAKAVAPSSWNKKTYTLKGTEYKVVFDYPIDGELYYMDANSKVGLRVMPSGDLYASATTNIKLPVLPGKTLKAVSITQGTSTQGASVGSTVRICTDASTTAASISSEVGTADIPLSGTGKVTVSGVSAGTPCYLVFADGKDGDIINQFYIQRIVCYYE